MGEKKLSERLRVQIGAIAYRNTSEEWAKIDALLKEIDDSRAAKLEAENKRLKAEVEIYYAEMARNYNELVDFRAQHKAALNLKERPIQSTRKDKKPGCSFLEFQSPVCTNCDVDCDMRKQARGEAKTLGVQEVAEKAGEAKS